MPYRAGAALDQLQGAAGWHAGFPWLGVLVFAPCALLAALGVQVPVTASVMTLDMVYNSSSLIWQQL